MKVSIKGSGSYIPPLITPNEAFNSHAFLQENGQVFEQENGVIIEKFKAITGIENRRYAPKHLNTSDLGFLAAQDAITDANIDPETIDYIIFGQRIGIFCPHADRVWFFRRMHVSHGFFIANCLVADPYFFLIGK